MFVDRHHNYSPDSVYPQYKGVTTNPCGEIFMQPYDACRLMAIKLISFVENPYTEKANVDWVKLYEMAYEQQRLADDLSRS
jgi:ribonucleoside-diphosphate reductase alpha chain